MTIKLQINVLLLLLEIISIASRGCKTRTMPCQCTTIIVQQIIIHHDSQLVINSINRKIDAKRYYKLSENVICSFYSLTDYRIKIF